MSQGAPGDHNPAAPSDDAPPSGQGKKEAQIGRQGASAARQSVVAARQSVAAPKGSKKTGGRFRMSIRALVAAASAVSKEGLRPPEFGSGLGRGSMIAEDDELHDPAVWTAPKEVKKPGAKKGKHSEAVKKIKEHLDRIERFRAEMALEASADWEQDLSNPANLGKKMVIDRVPVDDVSGLLGHITRSPVTGSILLQEVNPRQDFSLVDLWTREQITGCPEDIAKDCHLFWPSPLKRRTWIYHCIIRTSQEQRSISMMDDCIKKALVVNTVDSQITSGERSPVMLFAPTLPLVLLANDMLVFAMSFVTLFMCHLISIFTNTHWSWWATRPISLPFRLGFVALLSVRLAAIKGFEIFQVCGFLVPLVTFVYDFFAGDLVMLASLSERCIYNVLRELPNQVFVCSRSGGPGQKPHPPLRKELTGYGEGAVTLIANVQGLLVELIPLDPKRDAWELRNENSRALDEARQNKDMTLLHPEENDFLQIKEKFRQLRMRYCGLDVFNRRRRTVQDMDATLSRKMWKQWAQWATAPPDDPASQTISGFGTTGFSFKSNEEPLQVVDA